MTFATLLDFFKSLIKPLAALVIWIQAQRAERDKIKAAQSQKDAELAEDMLKNHDDRTPEDTLGKIKSGDF